VCDLSKIIGYVNNHDDLRESEKSQACSGDSVDYEVQ
jgi:hypothetical protein